MDPPKRGKRTYKSFLDPMYKKSEVDPRTDKRWRNIRSTMDINNINELGIIFFNYNIIICK